MWALRASGRLPTRAAVRGVLEVHAGADVVLVGHDTAWTLVAADLTGQPPDLERWASLTMPDVVRVEA